MDPLYYQLRIFEHVSKIDNFLNGGPLRTFATVKREAKNSFSLLLPENFLAGVFGGANNQFAIQFYLACLVFSVGPI